MAYQPEFIGKRTLLVLSKCIAPTKSSDNFSLQTGDATLAILKQTSSRPVARGGSIYGSIELDSNHFSGRSKGLPAAR